MALKVYFKNLHGFRFLAAMLVVLSHVELFKRRVGLQNVWDSPFFFEAGGAGVDFFFVLSGFLITSLLLKENDYVGRINLRKFYLRRILRIWPLYYLVLLVCYFVLPYVSIFDIQGYSEGIHSDFWSKFLFSVFFMPNVALAFLKDIPYAAPLWSIGVEEQFYLFWPLLLFAFSNKFRTIGLFIISFIAVKVVLIAANSFLYIEPSLFMRIKDLIVATRMECMGIGALGAYLFYKKHRLYNILYTNSALLVALISLPLVFAFAKNLFELHHIIFSVLFLIIILNGATNGKTPINLERGTFIMLGNISYGIYVWHSLCVGLFLKILMSANLHRGNMTIFSIVLYAGSFVMSICISWLSYRYFETPFLRMKSKLSIIVSGRDAVASSNEGKLLYKMEKV